MTARIRTPRAGRPQPLSDQDHADRAMCNCRRLPSGHQALHCRQLREAGGAR